MFKCGSNLSLIFTITGHWPGYVELSGVASTSSRQDWTFLLLEIPIYRTWAIGVFKLLEKSE